MGSLSVSLKTSVLERAPSIDYTAITVISAAVWVAFVAAPLVFSRFGKLRAQGIAVALAFALIIVQGVGVGSLFANSAALGAHADHVEYANSELVVTEEGLFDVSTKRYFGV